MCFLTFPPACNDLDKASTTHLKIAQNMYIFSYKLHTFPVTEGNKIWHIYFQFMTPARKLTHNTKFEHFWMQKDMNFGNTIIIRHLGPENCQNPTQKDTNFEKMHSLTPAKMPTNKESIRFPEFRTIIQMHSLTPSNTNQPITFGNT